MIVSPGVIGTDKYLAASLVLTAHLRAAVRAAVKEHVNAAITVTGNDHRAPAQVTGNKIPRFGNFTLVTDEHPGMRKNTVHLAPEQRFTGINRPVDTAFLDEVAPVSSGISSVH